MIIEGIWFTIQEIGLKLEDISIRESNLSSNEGEKSVNADAGKLIRAFENLLPNAIKYGRDGFYACRLQAAGIILTLLTR